MAGGEELLKYVRLAQVVIRSNYAAEGTPWVCIHPEAAVQPFRFLARYHLKVE